MKTHYKTHFRHTNPDISLLSNNQSNLSSNNKEKINIVVGSTIAKRELHVGRSEEFTFPGKEMGNKIGFTNNQMDIFCEGPENLAQRNNLYLNFLTANHHSQPSFIQRKYFFIFNFNLRL
jgi:hypothetical protein